MRVRIHRSLAYESTQKAKKLMQCFLFFIFGLILGCFVGSFIRRVSFYGWFLKRLRSKMRVPCSFLKTTHDSLSHGSVCVRAQADFVIGELRCSKTHLYTALRGQSQCIFLQRKREERTETEFI